jgi:hypothetical protein
MRHSLKPTLYALSLLGGAFTLSGCLEEIGTTRFNEPPTAVSPAIEFTDTHQGLQVGGTLKITPANDGQTEFDAWTFDSYVARWAIDGVPVQDVGSGPSSFIGRIDRMTSPLEMRFVTTAPVGANSIVVYTDNALGSAATGQVTYFENLYIDPRVPAATLLPEIHSFNDELNSVRVEGRLSFRRPPQYDLCTPMGCQWISDTETTITKYIIREADSNGCPLPRPALAEVAKNSSSVYQVSLGYNKVYVPGPEVASFAVIPANQYGEAYSENCIYAHTTNPINKIVPDTLSHYSAANVTLSPDTDSTDSLTATLDITRAIDERDLLTGYYIYWGYSSHSGELQELQYFPSDGQNHRFNFNRWVPTFANGAVADIKKVSIFVSTGQKNWSGNHVTEFKLGNDNRTVEGSWYLIRLNNEHTSDTSNYCIKADTENGDLQKAACDKYDEAQRFVVENAYVEGNDDMHYIKSVKFPNQCFFRPDEAAPNWRLNPCFDSWRMRAEIKALNTTTNERMNKKIGLNAGASWTCLAHYSVTNDLSSPWGNCGLVTPQIFQQFLRVGRSSDYGYFND